jgi:hypothetical protein
MFAILNKSNTFNDEDVEFVENQKHLGVTFSSNC